MPTPTAWSWSRTGTCANRIRTRRSTAQLPRLYEKYAGHDNNRDFYMANLPESTNMNRVMYLEWFPQIMYNHHQTGPAGTVMFAPPFRDPFNYNFDPARPGAGGPRWRRHGDPVQRRREAGRHEPPGFELLDLVERRAADDGLLSQHHRAPDGNHRQPDADDDPVRAVQTAPRRQPQFSDRATAVALPAVDRLLAHGELGGARHRLAGAGDLSLQHLPDGHEFDRARQQGQLDAGAAPGHRGAGGGRQQRTRRRRHRRSE